jgi:hypothetical protein
MANINLGSIKFNWQGAYAGGTAYAIDDVVSYNGSSYICILASTGNLPTNATYFEQMSSAGTNGTDLTSTLTTQGDILYRDGSGLVRLGAGTSGQFLKTLGTGANPIWADSSGAWVKLGEVEHSGSAVSTVDINFTPDDSVYKWYKLYISDWTGNGGNPFWRVKTGGSSISSNIYTTGGYGVANTGGGQFDSPRRDDTSDNRMHLDQTWTAYTSTDYGLAYDINFYKASSSQKKSFFWTHLINHNADNYVGTGIMGGCAGTTSALTGFTLFQSSGNINTLNAYVLGFKP